MISLVHFLLINRLKEVSMAGSSYLIHYSYKVIQGQYTIYTGKYDPSKVKPVPGKSHRVHLKHALFTLTVLIVGFKFCLYCEF